MGKAPPAADIQSVSMGRSMPGCNGLLELGLLFVKVFGSDWFGVDFKRMSSRVV